MTTNLEYALFSANVYGNSPDVRSAKNTLPYPDGWQPIGTPAVLSDGFMARAYQKGSEIVISYAGTTDENKLDWVTGNAPGGTAVTLAPQIIDAAKFYLDIVKANPGISNFSFTGHSLGGGLASLMSVYFDKPAVVFDEAPFQKSADSAKVVDELKRTLLAAGYTLPVEFIFYVTIDSTGSFLPSPTRMARDDRVLQIFTKGEVLSLASTALLNFVALALGIVDPNLWVVGTGVDKIRGSELEIDPKAQSVLGWSKFPTNGDPVALHSITLLTGFLQNADFLAVVQAYPELLPRLFDGLYANDPKNRRDANLTDLLVQREYRGEGSLGALAVDVNKINRDAGLTSLRSLPNSGGTGMNSVAAILMDAVLANLYVQGKDRSPTQPFASKFDTLLRSVPGGLTADMEALHKEANKVEAELNRMANLLLSNDAPAAVNVEGARWTLQNGTDALVADFGTDERQDVIVGYTAADTLSGGSGDDILIGLGGSDSLNGGAGIDQLYGGEGDDTLNGGLEGDWLYGGSGNDTYKLSSGQLSDVINDSDGNGSITVDGAALTGGKKAGDNYWISNDRQWGYLLTSSGDLVISKGSSLDNITIRDWQTHGGNKLGITLDNVAIPPLVTDRTLLGDTRAKFASEYGFTTPPDHYLWQGRLADGTLIDGVAEANFNDVITGNNLRDKIFGFGGNDALDGRGGNDDIYGGDGDDLIGGGTGSDNIYGGNGNDYINSSATLNAGQRYRPDDVWYSPEGAVLAQGSTWGIYQGTFNSKPVTYWGGSNSPDGNDADFVDGGAGNDWIILSGGGDFATGGDGDDQIDGLAGNDVLEGNNGKDKIHGDGLIESFWMNSVPASLHGNDFLDGGAGDDELTGGGGNDTLYGGADNDSIWGDSSGMTNDSNYVSLVYHGNDYLDGEAGDDYLEGGGKDDTLFGGTGNDNMWGDTSAANIASVGDNALVWGNDYLDGESGNDQLSGGGGNDTLYGGDGDDAIWGDDDSNAFDGHFAGNDYLDGGKGNDQLIGGGKNDTLYGGDGNDFLWGDNDTSVTTSTDFDGSDYLDGGAGNDQLVGGGGDDVLIGGDGDDLLIGGAGNDYLQGGLGNDRYVLDSQYDVVVEIDESANVTTPAMAMSSPTALMGGIQALTVSPLANVSSPGNVDTVEVTFDYSLGNNIENLILNGSANINGTGNELDNQIKGNSGNNILSGGGGNDSLIGGGGLDTLIGGDGDDFYTIDNSADVIVENANEGDDGVFTTVSYVLSDNVEGLKALGESNINLTGSAGSNDLHGNSGKNILAGKAGNDFLEGGGGDDIYLFNRGDGYDTINNFDFFQDRSNLALASAFDILRFGADVADTDVTAAITGNSLTFRIRGTYDAVVIQSYFLPTQYIGNVGSDYQIDRVEFGNGIVWDQSKIQTAIYAGANNHAPTLSHAQPDQIIAQGDAFSYTMPANTFVETDVGDHLVYTVSLNDGSPLPSWLQYNPTTKIFSGTPTDEGTVSVKVVATDDFGLSVQDVFDLIVKSPNMTGTSANDTLLGTNGNDTISGLDGDDTINAGGGNDLLDGGNGNDQIDGGSSDDTLIGGAGFDSLFGGEGNDTYIFNVGWGADLVGDSQGTNEIVFGPSINSANLIYDNFNGGSSTGDDLIITEKNSREYIRIAGLFNKGNAPTYSFSKIRFNDGTAVDIAALKNQITNGDEKSQTLVGTSNDDEMHGGGGNDGIDGRLGNDKIFGDDGDDTLYGDAGDDVLDGGVGNDSLFGGVGNNIFTGGAGDDKLYGEAGNDVFNFGQNQGNDYLEDKGGTDQIRLSAGVSPSDVSLVRTSNVISGANDSTAVDNLVLRVNSTGSELRISDFFQSDNKRAIESIVFNDGTIWNSTAILSRLINQSGAANTQSGTAANDIFLIDHPNDIINSGVAGGTDKVVSSINYVMPDASAMPNLLNVELSGVLNINATGNAANNILKGNSGDNILTSVGGFDTLIGGLGNDTYVIENLYQDTLVENPGEGIDTIVTAYWTLNLPTNFENLTSTDTGSLVADSYVGNDLDNVIDGSSASSGTTRLDGGIGADKLIGGATDDTYVVDNVNDVVIENAATASTSKDTVESSVSYTLGSKLENLVLTGSAAINGTGNDLNNILDGSKNTGINHLFGGLGDDRIIVGSGDVAHENIGEGTDTIVIANSTVGSYSLSSYANFENIGLDDLAGDSTILGDSANNIVTGNAGNNSLYGGLGDDTIYDDITGKRPSPGNPYLQYPIYDIDSLFGGDGNDRLISFSGDDSLDGGAGDDELTGGRGNNTYIFGHGYGHDRIVAEAGDNNSLPGYKTEGDVIVLKNDIKPSDVVLQRLGATLQVQVRNSQDSIDVENFFSNGTSWYTGNTIERLQFADGSYWDVTSLVNRLQSGNSDLVSSTNDVINGGLGNDVIDGLVGDDVIRGDTGNDQLLGNVGNDRLFGGEGNDILVGGVGNDTLIGGNGADTYRFSRGFGSDVIVELGAASTTEIDTIEFASDIAVTDVIVEKGGWGAHRPLVIKVVGTGDQITLIDKAIDWLNPNTPPDQQGWELNYTDSLERVKFADGTIWTAADLFQFSKTQRGTESADSMFGDASDNIIYGNGGNDTIDGGDGNDLLDGGAGVDRLTGGNGDDTFIVENVGDVVVEASNGGNDTVKSSVTYSLADNVENLTLTGTAVINGTGNALNNLITGNIANNILSGGAGADTMIGGAGNDTYVVDDIGDVVTENLSEGTDLVQSAITYTLGSNLENLTLIGTAAINGIGNALANTINGNSGNNILDGGVGADTLIGGAGNDTYIVDNVGDVVTEAASAGTDVVQSSVSFTLGANVENLTLTGTSAINGTGNTLVNTITGNAGNNILDGGTGADTLIGGAGDDTYIVDNTADVVTENASAGNDLVQSSITYVLGANLENLTLTGTAAINGTGNTVANTIIGNSAANIIDGGAGADTMKGGAGNDTYIVDNVGDVITENLSEGTDLVQSSVSFTLGANVENLTLTGTAAINGTGNTLANTINGNSGNNVLDGGAGIDTLVGGAGNDTYIVDNVGDVVTEAASAGTDTVQSSVTYTLGANVENLTLTGSAAINGTGNTLDNVLYGNSAANVLTGGAGNDTYYVSTGDTVTEAASAGTDTVIANVSWTLGANLENLTLTGTAAINATGNTLVNTILGNTGNNILDGGTGADILKGAAGNDTYIVDNVGDAITENAAEGIDLVQSSVTYTLATNVEALTLTGTAVINGTGNANDNLIIGSSVNNTLNGAAGNDILQGAAGVDTLTDTAGNNLLDGGIGNDVITGGTGNDFIIGGAGADTITTGTGADVIAFNLGDGADIVNASTTKDNTLSLGKGIKYADLLFKKNGNDLILVTGATDQVTFKDWYLATTNHSIANLQIVIEGTTDYNAASNSVINNKKIENFNFDGLVTKFDQARTATPTLTSWALSSSLLSFYLTSSDTAAIGGDLAYQYAKNGNLSNISLTPADTILSSAQFGTSAQNLQAVASLQDLSPRLM